MILRFIKSLQSYSNQDSVAQREGETIRSMEQNRVQEWIPTYTVIWILAKAPGQFKVKMKVFSTNGPRNKWKENMKKNELQRLPHTIHKN